MKPFKIEEYIKNPNQILVLEHYKEPVEYWPIKEATLVLNEQLAVRVPETGYATCEVNLVDGDTIRDDDGNLVGYIRVAEPGDLLPICIEVLSRMVAEMKVGDTIDFNQREDEDHWGVNKIHILGADVLVIGSYGGGSTYLHDLTIDGTQKDILEFLTHSLDDKASGLVYWEIPKPKDKSPQEIILLYSTDAWHSNPSRELVGIFSDGAKFSDYLSEMKRADQLTVADFNAIVNRSQTQGNDTNYLVETKQINPRY